MTRFRDLRDRPPPTTQFLAILKKLHQTSVSPTGKFGFQVTTYNGPPKMCNDWTDCWEECFARQFRSDIAFLQNVYGEDPELAELTEAFIQKVVARLLRPLQTGGRNIKPSLCHGDLWDGNVQIDVNTKQPIVFDSCAFYGHNESQHTPCSHQSMGRWVTKIRCSGPSKHGRSSLRLRHGFHRHV